MDPLSAIGLAGNIVQFVDFASKLVTGTISLARSSTGRKAEHEETDILARSIVELSETIVALETASIKLGGLSRREKSLLPLRGECVNLGNELIEVLRRLQVSDSRKRWDTVRVGLYSILKEGKIKDLESRLTRMQRQIDSHLIADIQKQQKEILELLRRQPRLSASPQLQGTKDMNKVLKHIDETFEKWRTPNFLTWNLSTLKKKKSFEAITEDSCEATFKKLKLLLTELEADHRVLEHIHQMDAECVEVDMNVLTEELTHALEAFDSLNVPDTMKLQRAQVPEIDQIEDATKRLESQYAKEFARPRIISLRRCLDLLSLAQSVDWAWTMCPRRSFLVALDYDARTMRQHTIKRAHANTFQWILNQQTTFMYWLAREDGIYWISGKPGSGKSTLMKYLCDRPEIQRALASWARGRRLVTVSFYFWNSGTPMQRSLNGLLRSVLVQVLDQCPELIPKLFPGRWEEVVNMEYVSPILAPWTIQELLDALHLLTKEALSSKFCFFIDGLDEYEGSDREMVQIIKDFSTSKDLKFCLSSRPHVDFRKAYGHMVDRVLFVSDLTKGDIALFVRDSLDQNDAFQVMKAEYPDRCQRLREDIVNHASGVFLWVFLVVSRLVEGIEVNNDRMSDLERKLENIPKELDQLFRLILDSVDESYHELQAHMIRVACCTDEPLDLMAYHYMDAEDENHAFKLPVSRIQPSMVLQMQKIMQTRLNVRCKGLLEVVEPPASAYYPEPTVQLIHRTFRDFVLDKEIQGFLKRRSAPDFDPWRHIGLGVLAEIKTLYGSGNRYRECQFYRLIDSLFHYFFEAELTADVSHGDILHEVKRILPQLPHLAEGDFRWTERSWSCAMQLVNEPDAEWFTTMAVEKGLTRFVRNELKTSVSRPRLNKLLESLFKPHFDTVYPVVLNPAMVELLLEHGADPDISWRRCVEKCNDDMSSSQDEDVRKAVCYSMKLSLEHGARPTETDRALEYARKCSDEDAGSLEQLILSRKSSSWLSRLFY